MCDSNSYTSLLSNIPSLFIRHALPAEKYFAEINAVIPLNSIIYHAPDFSMIVYAVPLDAEPITEYCVPGPLRTFMLVLQFTIVPCPGVEAAVSGVIEDTSLKVIGRNIPRLIAKHYDVPRAGPPDDGVRCTLGCGADY